MVLEPSPAPTIHSNASALEPLSTRTPGERGPWIERSGLGFRDAPARAVTDPDDNCPPRTTVRGGQQAGFQLARSRLGSNSPQAASLITP